MNGFCGTQYPTEDLQQQAATQRQYELSQTNGLYSVHLNHDSAHQLDPDCGAIDTNSEILSRDRMDDILIQNNTNLQQTQTIPGQYTGQEGEHPSSILEMGSKNDGLHGLNRLQFSAPNVPTDREVLRHPSGALGMEGFGVTQTRIGMQTAQMSISQGMQGQIAYNNTSSMFQSMSYTPTNIEKIQGDDSHGLNTFPTPCDWNFGGFNVNQMGDDLMMSSSMLDFSSSRYNGLHDEDETRTALRMPQVVDEKNISNSSRDLTMNQPITTFGLQAAEETSPVVPDKDVSFPTQEIAPTIWPEAPPVKPLIPQPSEIYCGSGFDMIGALAKVATRKNPEINLGKVDLSCAFAVCDASQYDCPIVYVSEVFERLTGYSKYEVKGQNCRFLQSPDGNVVAGAKREFVDNDSVYFLREKIRQNKEAQRNLINYRKGGQPFMNLLTVIPITGEDNITIRYFVGFQIDLVQKPSSVERKNAGGVYTVDYCQSVLPRYAWQPSNGNTRSSLEIGQTISREDVSTVLASIKTGTESELTKRMWDKVLLENTDDVVHVLSLKGLFLYLSTSSRNVLEYDASELIGKALSEVCHPSDIVPVTRELKDASTGTTVNVIFRIRRKQSGYIWFESHGSLCVEQGKGRKCIILVGREKPVYVLHRHDIEASGGIGENEMWNKISTSGMFLYVSSFAQNLLGRSPDDLLGTSIQALMTSESKMEFGRSLESARNGNKVTYRHEILCKKGLMMQAQTTLYPGDSSNRLKATFLVAQTKFIKSPCTIAPAPNPVVSNYTASVDQPGFLSEKQNYPPHPSEKEITRAGGMSHTIGSQHVALASETNIFDELKTTRCTSWQFELRQMEKSNRLLAEELAALLSNKKKRKRRKGAGYLQKDCANCHTQVTPEWRRGPSGLRDLCNSCGLRYAKQIGRVSSRTSARDVSASNSASSVQSSFQQEVGRSRVKFATENSNNTSLNTSKSPNKSNTVSKTNGNTGSTGDCGLKMQEDHTVVEPNMNASNGVMSHNRAGQNIDLTCRGKHF